MSDHPMIRRASVSRPVRLLHITTVPLSLIFFRGHRAHLRTRGFEVHVASSPGDMLDEIAVHERVPTYTISMSRGMNPLADLVSLIRLWMMIARLRPDIVHSHTPKAGLLGTLAARLAGVPAVMVSVFGLPQMTRQGWSRRLLDFTTRVTCAAAHRVWCDSPSMSTYLARARLCAPRKLVVLGQGSVSGVDTAADFNPDRYSQAERIAVRSEHGIPAGAQVLGFVGRIAADKGTRELTASWQRLRARFPQLHLLLVGPQDARDPMSLEDAQILQGDERVHLTGMRNDIPRQLAAMDLFVNPSYREGFGLANLEASAMQLPVVSTRIPGCLDSVQDGVTGTLVPVRDALALTDAIARYLDYPELAARHGRAGRSRVVGNFQPAALWTALEHQYRELLGIATDVSDAEHSRVEPTVVAP